MYHMHNTHEFGARRPYIDLCVLRVRQQHIEVSSVVRLEPLRAERCGTKPPPFVRCSMLQSMRHAADALLLRQIRGDATASEFSLLLPARSWLPSGRTMRAHRAPSIHTPLRRLTAHKQSAFSMQTATNFRWCGRVSLRGYRDDKAVLVCSITSCPARLQQKNNGEEREREQNWREVCVAFVSYGPA